MGWFTFNSDRLYDRTYRRAKYIVCINLYFYNKRTSSSFSSFFFIQWVLQHPYFGVNSERWIDNANISAKKINVQCMFDNKPNGETYRLIQNTYERIWIHFDFALSVIVIVLCLNVLFSLEIPSIQILMTLHSWQSLLYILS